MQILYIYVNYGFTSLLREERKKRFSHTLKHFEEVQILEVEIGSVTHLNSLLNTLRDYLAENSENTKPETIIYDGPFNQKFLTSLSQHSKQIIWSPSYPLSSEDFRKNTNKFHQVWLWQFDSIFSNSSQITPTAILSDELLRTSITSRKDACTIGLPIEGPVSASKAKDIVKVLANCTAKLPAVCIRTTKTVLPYLVAAGLPPLSAIASDNIEQIISKSTIVLGTSEASSVYGVELAKISGIPSTCICHSKSLDKLKAVGWHYNDQTESVSEYVCSFLQDTQSNIDVISPIAVSKPLLQTLAHCLLGDTTIEPAAFSQNLISNSNISIEILNSYFNSWNRIVEVVIQANCDEGLTNLFSGEITCQQRDLSNAFVTPVGYFNGGVLIKVVAVVPPDLELTDLVVEIFVGDVAIKSYRLAEIDIPLQTGGLISLDIENNEAIASHWSSNDDKIQHGKSIIAPNKTIPLCNRPTYYETRSSWPMNRETLSVIPAEDAIAQRFRDFDGLSVDLPPSAPLLRDMKDAYSGKRAWLIGNGPSVQISDLDKLANEVTFCFNRFYLAHNDTKLRSTFTVSADHQMIEDFGEEIVREAGGHVFLANNTPPKINGKYHWLRQVKGYPSLFSQDPSLRVTPGGSSVYVAMQIGYYLGIREFYIYGADFKFSFQQTRAAASSFRTAKGDGNHFIKNYRSGKAWAPPSIQNIMSSFLAARTLIEAQGGKILNVTRGGELEVFKRGNFDDVIST